MILLNLIKETKQQISVIAMGTNFPPLSACIFMDKVQTEFLEKELLKIWAWLRYIGNIFFVMTLGKESLQKFLEHLNNFHPGLRFTSEISVHQVNFLDFIVRLQENEFFSFLYCTKTDNYQHLHYDSCHPEHMKRFSVYSEHCVKSVPNYRVFSGPYFSVFWQEKTPYLGTFQAVKRLRINYPENNNDNQLNPVKNKSREELVKPKEKGSKTIGIPFIFTYHLHLKTVKRFVWYNLYDSQSVLRSSLRLHCHTGCSYKVIKFVYTAYSIFRSLNTVSEKQAAAAIIIALLLK